jgi:hypothetical protein
MLPHLGGSNARLRVRCSAELGGGDPGEPKAEKKKRGRKKGSGYGVRASRPFPTPIRVVSESDGVQDTVFEVWSRSRTDGQTRPAASDYFVFAAFPGFVSTPRLTFVTRASSSR